MRFSCRISESRETRTMRVFGVLLVVCLKTSSILSDEGGCRDPEHVNQIALCVPRRFCSAGSLLQEPGQSVCPEGQVCCKARLSDSLGPKRSTPPPPLPSEVESSVVAFPTRHTVPDNFPELHGTIPIIPPKHGYPWQETKHVATPDTYAPAQVQEAHHNKYPTIKPITYIPPDLPIPIPNTPPPSIYGINASSSQYHATNKQEPPLDSYRPLTVASQDIHNRQNYHVWQNYTKYWHSYRKINTVRYTFRNTSQHVDSTPVQVYTFTIPDDAGSSNVPNVPIDQGTGILNNEPGLQFQEVKDSQGKGFSDHSSQNEYVYEYTYNHRDPSRDMLLAQPKTNTQQDTRLYSSHQPSQTQYLTNYKVTYPSSDHFHKPVQQNLDVRRFKRDNIRNDFLPMYYFQRVIPTQRRKLLDRFLNFNRHRWSDETIRAAILYDSVLFPEDDNEQIAVRPVKVKPQEPINSELQTVKEVSSRLSEDVSSQPQWKHSILSRNTRKRPGQKSYKYCQEYKRLSTEYSLAMPLLPKVHPFRIAMRGCQVPSPLIVGGSEAMQGEFPHMAGIGFRREMGIDWLCGGSLISDQFVLTAAHCTHTKWGPPVMVRLGSRSLHNSVTTIDISIDRVIPHPHYKTPECYSDIALLKLSTKAELTHDLRPACLPAFEDPGQKSGDLAIATGWGRVAFGREPSSTLLKVSLAIIDRKECSGYYAEDMKTARLQRGITLDMLCAAGYMDASHDTCQGDSGGPLQSLVAGDECTYNIIGITSFGKICGAGVPGVYTRVSAFIPWIESIVWP